jgi:hypothetical protein
VATSTSGTSPAKTSSASTVTALRESWIEEFDRLTGETSPTLAVRTGGFSADELRRAGAAEVSESLEDLLADLDNTPLSRPHGH